MQHILKRNLAVGFAVTSPLVRARVEEVQREMGADPSLRSFNKLMDKLCVTLMTMHFHRHQEEKCVHYNSWGALRLG